MNGDALIYKYSKERIIKCVLYVYEFILYFISRLASLRKLASENSIKVPQTETKTQLKVAKDKRRASISTVRTTSSDSRSGDTKQDC